MFGKMKKTQVEQPPVKIEILTEKQSVYDALKTFKLFDTNSINVSDDDFIVQENIEWIQDDKKHIRKDYIIHPKSAITKLGDNRFMVEVKNARRIDDLINLHMNPETSHLFFKETLQRFLTNDGWDLYKNKGVTLIEVQSDIYKPCEECHETIPNYYWNDYNGGHIGRRDPSSLREVRTYRIKIPLQVILHKTGMVITEIEHPCTRSLQELLEPNYNRVADPPQMKVVFPKDFKL